ncbi:reverse transcriptase domain-containing protein, partial [Tanacetum coccineum]
VHCLGSCKTSRVEVLRRPHINAIHYKPRVSVKGQILADFIVERSEEDSLDTPMEVEEELLEPWILFDVTNNEAEYEALIARLRIAEQMGVKNLQANVDSRLVANQVNGTYVAKEADMIRYLEKVHKPIPRNPQQKLTPITSPWSFYKWGIDIAGPFLEGPGKVKFLIVAIDYFTKWIEAKPVATITGNQVKKFVWDNIVCRFRLPGEIISDNGKQFQDNPFKDWCEKLSRLGAKNKNWLEELSHVLWAHRTMIKSSNGETPFSLTYGIEAVIPAEIGMPILRTAEVDLVQNNEALEINLDLLEEKREQAAIHESKSKAKMEKYYNSKVRGTSFKPGDLVYRNNDASRAEDTGKLGPKWEGPYEVTEALGKGAYKLRDRDGKQLPRTWNISNLKKCYVHKM